MMITTSGLADAKPLHAGLDYHRYLQEKDAVAERLQQWMQSASGQTALENNWGISQQESRSAEPTEDQLQRFALTEQSIEKMREMNPEANFSTDSPFTMMTDEEFSNYVGQSFAAGEKMWSTPAVSMGEHEYIAARDGETTVDWSQSGCVGRVKDQGKCGSCWAFGTIAAVESGYCIRTGQLTHFSDQQLTSCTQYGCRGGWPQNALQYVMQTGVCTEDAYPYESGRTRQNGQCQQNQCQRTNVGISRVVHVSGGDQGLENAVRGRPVAVGLAAGNSAWKQYRGGVLTQCTSTKLDHVVLVYGFTPDAWLVKNSWGANWGENGFIRLKRSNSNNGNGGQRRRGIFGIFGGWGGGGGDSNGLCGMHRLMVYPEM